MNKRTIILFTCFLLLGKSDLIFCQGYYHKTPKGLKKSNISTVYSMKLRNDTLFIGHNDGFAIYNGIHFENIRFQDGNSKACDNLTLTKDGRIWGRTFSGDIFYYKNKQLIKHPISKQKSQYLPTFTQSNNATYLHLNKTIYLLNNKKFSKLFNIEESVNPTIQSVNDSTDIWCGGDEGSNIIHLKKLTKRKKQATEHSDKTIWDFFRIKKHKSYHNYIGYFTFNFNKKKLYFNCNNHLFFTSDLFTPEEKERIDSINKIFKYPKNAKINEINFLNNRYLTFTGHKGINIIDLETNKSHHFLKNTITTRVEISKRGEVWVGTKKDGIIYIPSLTIKNTNFKTKLKTYRSHKISDSLFAVGGVNGKVEIYDTRKNLKHHFKSNRTAEVYSITGFESKIYFSTDILSTYDTKTKKINHGNLYLPIKDMYISKNLKIASTSSSIKHLNQFDSTQRYKSIVKSNWYTDIEPYTNKKLLIASTHGLFYFDKQKQTLQTVTTQLKNSSLSIRQVKYCNSNIYILTEGKKVYFIDQTNKKAIQTPDIPNIKKIKTYNNKLYALNESGVFLLDKQKQPECVFDSQGVLSDFETQDFEILNETIFLIGKNNFLSVPLNNFSTNYAIYLQKTEQNNLGTFKFKNGKYQSNYEDNRLILHFKTFPSFNHFASTKITYQIEGSKKEWTPLKLENGLYVLDINWIPWNAKKINLRVQRGNYESFLSYKLRIEKPYWYQSWFIGLCILTLFTLTYLVYRIRVHQLEKKSAILLKEQSLKNQLLSAELTAIRSQMQPHFIYNTLTSIQSKILSGDKKNAFDSANSFSKLIRNVLDNSDKEFISLKEEIIFLKSYVKLESDRIDGGIYFDFHCDTSINQTETIIPTLICQPIIENSFLHGLRHSKEDKKLSLQITKEKNGILISIEDNGIGRDESQKINSERKKKHQSFATIALKERIQKINSSDHELKVTYQIEDLQQGTKVTIKITYAK